MELSKLLSNTIYYYRAYMVSGGNTYYGSVNSFTTSQGELVTTGDATDITFKSATITSSFKYSYITTYKELGVRYAESKDALENGFSQKETTSTVTNDNTFAVTLTNLTEQTTYYYQAYVIYYETTYYGEIKSFTTLKNTVDYNGHEYVDLGLPSGTKWATMNVGASKPEDFGDYYAWGEITSKTSYTEENYTWQGLTTNEFVSHGVVSETRIDSYNSIYTLTSAYDVATVKWGSAWRMPTQDEISELEKYTNSIFSEQNGVEGYFMTSRINQKSIFLPRTGHWQESGFNNYYCAFWSSGCYGYHSGQSISLVSCIKFYGQSSDIYSFAEPYEGLTIRPVTSY